jgi:putative colanic acid biosynthesis acetyltransferase WcaF
MALDRVTPPNTRDRLRRYAWQWAWLLLFRPSPVPLHGWRRWLLRCFGAKVGARAHPYPSARIWAPWNLTMEAGSCLGLASDCYNVARVTLRRDAIVSQRAYLCTASHDIDAADFALTAEPIEIGPGAWVAADAFIGPGVTMAANAVAAARAVVTKDVAVGVVVAGNPARELRQRLAARDPGQAQ